MHAPTVLVITAEYDPLRDARAAVRNRCRRVLGSWARRDEALRTDEIDPTDQPLSVIATPTQVIRIKRPSAAPAGMDWTRLSAQDLEEMPILAELKENDTIERLKTPQR